MPTDIATLLSSFFWKCGTLLSSCFECAAFIVCDIQDSVSSITNNLMDATTMKSKYMEETTQAASLRGVAVSKKSKGYYFHVVAHYLPATQHQLGTVYLAGIEITYLAWDTTRLH